MLSTVLSADMVIACPIGAPAPATAARSASASAAAPAVILGSMDALGMTRRALVRSPQAARHVEAMAAFGALELSFVGRGGFTFLRSWRFIASPGPAPSLTSPTAAPASSTTRPGGGHLPVVLVRVDGAESHGVDHGVDRSGDIREQSYSGSLEARLIETRQAPAYDGVDAETGHAVDATVGRPRADVHRDAVPPGGCSPDRFPKPLDVPMGRM